MRALVDERKGLGGSRALPAIAVVAFAVLGTAAGAVANADEPEGSIAAEEIQSCLAANCHAYRMAFKKSPHSVLDTEGVAGDVDASSSCAACHGEPVRKEKEHGVWACDFDVFGFSEDDFHGVKTQLCQRCHAGDHGEFGSSEHARAGIACTDCHDIHGENRGRWPLQKEITVHDGSALQAAAPSATCARCHADVFAEFEFNDRHRLQEGIVQCTSCHDPHRRQGRTALAGFRQETCAACHLDKDGPYVFEHGSLRVEGCAACHTPHGSPNRHMLTFQAVAELCYSCHVEVPGFHSRFTLDTQCTNCHSSIHGSNIDPFFLR